MDLQRRLEALLAEALGGLSYGATLYILRPSPRAWGLLALRIIPPPPMRAIPTCVGTTIGVSIGQGSNIRAIPTCVGTTNGGGSPTRPTPGHPHMRGDYEHLAGRLRALGGPSPHAWGLRMSKVDAVAQARAIPTCVGTTPVSLRGRTGEAGHPHMRGDYARPIRSKAALFGPSPHAWGLRVPALRAPRLVGPSPHAWGLRPGANRRKGPPRAIPTCVGTTPPTTWP